MGISAFSLLSISLINLFLAILVFSRNHKQLSNIFFSFFILGGSLWSLGILFFMITTSPELSIAIVRFIYFCISVATISFLLFALTFPVEDVLLRANSLRIFVVFFALFSLWVVLSPDKIIQGFEVIQGNREPVFGFGFFVHSFLEFIVLLSGFVLLFIKYRKLSGANRLQLKYLFTGAVLSVVIALTTNVFLPAVGISNLVWVGPFGLVFFIGFTSYAIVKHRLMDIRLVVARSVAYSLLIVMVAGMYAAGVMGLEKLLFPGASDLSLAQGALRTLLAVVIAFTFQPLKNWITKSTDKIFFKDMYDAEEFLKETNNILSTHIVLTELLYKTLDHILKTLKVENGMFAVVEEDKVYTVQSIGYKTAPTVEIKDLKYLSRFPLVVSDEEEEGSRKKDILRRYDAALSVKLIEEHQFAGFLFLGDKKSGDMLSVKDIEIMEILAPQVAMAMQRAKQYEEIQKFNITLRAEVLRKTKKLREANDHLKELDKAKDEFISMASHQLRTPLTAIKGYLSMLLEGDAGEIKIGQFDFINEAFQGANKMVNLINDLLNVSRMTTGKFFIDLKEVDIKSIINYEITQLAPAARNKGLYLKFEAPKVLPKVECDENKITQVVMNFIDNAIYYTETGGITIRASATKHDFVFEVHDTGIGVPKEARSNLFAKFYRADNAKRLRPDGTGLGIYLAKRVIEDHGGEIIFRTQVGKGSVFGFRVPVKSKVHDREEKKMMAGKA